MRPEEQAIVVECEGARLFGILHRPAAAGPQGVLVVVGGPQYRVGSHRQFVLLARHLATGGVPVFRFDYRGMGDSQGAPRSFEDVGMDIRRAMDTFLEHVDGLSSVVIWGLCDAASAACIYAPTDSRVSGLVLANPWVRTEAGIAKAYLKHYYLSRLFSRGLWAKVLRGQFSFAKACRSLSESVIKALAGSRDLARQTAEAASSEGAAAAPGSLPSLPERMRHSLEAFDGSVLLILSGRDLTAQEFDDLVKGSRAWRRLLKRTQICRYDLPDADHTFSTRVWRDLVAEKTLAWVRGGVSGQC